MLEEGRWRCRPAGGAAEGPRLPWSRELPTVSSACPNLETSPQQQTSNAPGKAAVTQTRIKGFGSGHVLADLARPPPWG